MVTINGSKIAQGLKCLGFMSIDTEPTEKATESIALHKISETHIKEYIATGIVAKTANNYTKYCIKLIKNASKESRYSPEYKITHTFNYGKLQGTTLSGVIDFFIYDVMDSSLTILDLKYGGYYSPQDVIENRQLHFYMFLLCRSISSMLKIHEIKKLILGIYNYERDELVSVDISDSVLDTYVGIMRELIYLANKLKAKTLPFNVGEACTGCYARSNCAVFYKHYKNILNNVIEDKYIENKYNDYEGHYVHKFLYDVSFIKKHKNIILESMKNTKNFIFLENYVSKVIHNTTMQPIEEKFKDILNAWTLKPKNPDFSTPEEFVDKVSVKEYIPK